MLLRGGRAVISILSCGVGMPISSPGGQGCYCQAVVSPIFLSVPLWGVPARSGWWLNIRFVSLRESKVQSKKIFESLLCRALKVTIVVGGERQSFLEKDAGTAWSSRMAGQKYWLLLSFFFNTWIQQKNEGVRWGWHKSQMLNLFGKLSWDFLGCQWFPTIGARWRASSAQGQAFSHLSSRILVFFFGT